MLYSQLGIQKGITAVIGSGGKTTLLSVLAQELPGTVLLCTSTHIRPFAEAAQVLFEGDAEADAAARILEALAGNRIVCTGTKTTDGKLTAPPVSFAALECMAAYVLVEADGARGLPLKAHASYEPVIPENAARVICVAGAQGFGKPVKEAVHRPEIFCGLLNITPDTIVTPQLAGAVLRAEHLTDTLLINQADTEELQKQALECAKASAYPHCFTGALRNRQFERREHGKNN